MRRLRRGGFQRARRSVRRGVAINLVSLMDIFTILVFFLLVNSSDVEVLPGNTPVRLPESLAEKKPEETLVLVVDDRQILLQGRKVVDLDALGAEELITPLKEALLAARLPQDKQGSVTIMGDKAIPYKVLRRIMRTCAETNFGDISLAVQRKVAGNG